MVNPTSGIGGVQNVTGAGKTQQSSEKSKAEISEARSSGPVDEVRISQEALSLSDAEATARNARTQLQENQTQSLSGNKAGALEDLLV